MDKKAGGVIWVPFLQFLSNFNETLSISLFFRGRLNRALRSDLTPLHSAHFTTAQRGLCTDFQTFLFIKVESWFFLCGIELRFHNILIHYCSGVRSDLSARFKRPQKEKLMLRVSLKLLKNWRNCRQISFRACLPVSPFKIYEFGYISFDSKLVPSVNIFTNCTK